MDDFIADLNSVLDDPRDVEAKERDYKTSDLAGAIDEIEWKEETEVIAYEPRQQNSSLSCMAQAAAKGLETFTKKVYSAHPPYRSRSNYPSGGMWLQNLLDIMKNIGTNYESICKSQYLNEKEMNRDIECATPFKAKGYGFPDRQNNIDDIAKAIQKYGHCVILIHANKNEYTKPIPEVIQGSTIDFGHGICAIGYYLRDGKKVLKIEDSTGWNSTIDKKGTRYLTEDFLKARCSGSGYMIMEDPQYIFKTFMKKGFVSNEVKELQKRLNKELGLFLAVDGKFGFFTENAVKDYQKRNGLVSDGLVGAKTRAVLNKGRIIN